MGTATLEAPISRPAARPAIERTGLLARLQYPILGILLLAFFVVGWQGREPSMRAAGEDEFVYLALSKSMATGSYREIFRPTAPLHVQYPPVYPAWLAISRQVAGENLDAFRVANLIMAAGALLLMFSVMRRFAGPGLGLALVLLLVLNRDLLRMSGAIVSENLFLLLTTAALAWTVSAEASGKTSPAPAILLALLSFLTRSIGLATVLGVGYWLWSSRRWRPLAAWAVASVLVVGAWFSYTSIAANSGVRSYTSDFAAVSASTGGTLRHFAARIWDHGVEYATSGMPYALSLPTVAGTRLDNWVWLLLNGVLLTTGWVILWRRWRAAAVFLPVYIGLVLVWPYMDGRLLVPLIPLGIMALLLGAQRVARLLPLRGRTVALGLVVALLTVGAGQGALKRLVGYRACDRANPFASHGCYSEETLALAAAASWLRQHSDPADIVLSQYPASMNYLSGHRTESLGLATLPTQNARDTLRARNIRFVVVTVPWTAQTLLSSCTGLRLEADYSPFALVLSTAELGDSADACSTLQTLAHSRRLLPE